MAPEVSVCIPAYRAAEILAPTLRSILASDHPDFEVVVIDNASPDATWKVVERFTDDPRVRFLRFSEHVGLPENWCRAVDSCEGELVKLVCADDLIHPTALSRQAAVLRSEPGVALVASRRHVIDGDGYVLARASGLHSLIGRHTAAEVARLVVRYGINPIGEPGSVMFRRSAYHAAGGWNGDRVFNMDIDLFLRILGTGDLYGTRESLAAFRVWPQSMSSHHSAEQFEDNLRFIRDVSREYGLDADDRQVARATTLAWRAWSARRWVWSRTPRLWSRPLMS